MKRGTILQVVLATTVFALVHSALASRQAKDAAAQLLGERTRNGLYRPFYLVQSAITVAGLVLYLWRLPDRVLYRAQGLVARLLNLGQLLGLVYATYAAAQIGAGRLLGLTGLAALLGDHAQVPPEAEAQGPRPDEAGQMRVAGPFRWSRHPLNFAPLPVFWLMPTMTLKLLAFNLVATLYLVLGSIHEETRLHAAYGAAYAAYQRSGISFYLPLPPPA